MRKQMMIAGVALASGLGSSAVTAVPAVQVDATIGAASQYIFRGIESGQPQIWGAVDASMGNTYGGVWVSNTSVAGDEEVNIYGGINLGPVDLGALYYLFPSSEGGNPSGNGTPNVTEVYAGVNAAGASFYAWASPGAENDEGNDAYVYLDGNYDISLGENVTLGLHAGYMEPLNDSDGAKTNGNSHAGHFDFAATLGMGDFWLAVSYLEDENGGAGVNTSDNPSVSVGYSWTFEDVAK